MTNEVRACLWQTANIADIASALLLANGNPDFQDGVLALCRALNAQPVIPARLYPVQVVYAIEAAQ